MVAQYPPAGTEVYVGETVEVYFYNASMLITYKELTLDFPTDVTTMGDTFDVRIESRQMVGAGSFADILFNERVERKAFPVKYSVKLPVNNMPVKVTIYLNGTVYRQITVTADYTEKKE